MSDKKDEKKTAAKKPAAKKKAPAKKPAAKKPVQKAEVTTEIKQTQSELAESMKGAKSSKASTRSTDAAKQSRDAKNKAVKNVPKGKTLTVTQIGSPIGRGPKQRQTLIGLGLNKMHKTRTLEDTPAIRGMIRKVRHLVKIEDAA